MWCIHKETECLCVACLFVCVFVFTCVYVLCLSCWVCARYVLQLYEEGKERDISQTVLSKYITSAVMHLIREFFASPFLDPTTISVSKGLIFVMEILSFVVKKSHFLHSCVRVVFLTVVDCVFFQPFIAQSIMIMRQRRRTEDK